MPLAFTKVPAGLFPGLGGCFSTAGRKEFHARAQGLRKADGNGLLGRARAVLSFSNEMHLLTDKLFTGLRAG
jgi:hypothetical protein